MALTKYTKTTLLPDEKIIYAADLHAFTRYVSIILIAIGIFIIMPSEGNISNEMVESTTGTIHHYLSNFRNKIYDHLYSMPAEFQSMISTVMSIRTSFTGILILIVGLFMLITSLIKKFSIEQVITSRKIIYKKGLVEVNEVEIPLNHVEGVKVKQTALDRIIGRGNILITGIGMEMIEVKKIKKPADFRMKSYEAIDVYNKEIGTGRR